MRDADKALNILHICLSLLTLFGKFEMSIHKYTTTSLSMCCPFESCYY